MTTLSEQVIQYLEKQSEPQPAAVISHKVKCSATAVNDVLDKLEKLNVVESGLIDGRIRWSLVPKESVISASPALTAEHTHSILAEQPKVEIKIEVEQRRSIPGIGLQTRRDLVLETLHNSTQPLSCIDIASQAKLKVQGVACVLTKLKNQGLVVNENGCWQITGKNSGVVIPEPVVTKKNQIEWTSKVALSAPQTEATESGTPILVAQRILPTSLLPVSELKFGYFSDGGFSIQCENQTMLLKPDQVRSLMTFVKKCQLEVSL